MTPFERGQARVMAWLFVGGWGLMMLGWLGVAFGRAFAWRNVVPFSAGGLMLFISGPHINGRLWSWIWRNWLGGGSS